jgi:RimJ/RimL family protein N-acetyltransferase
MVNKLKMVECDEKYWEFVRILRNNPEVQDGFIESDYISKENQITYMQKNSSFFKVCLKNDVPVGYIGVINNDIRICTLPQYQNQGVGSYMVMEIKKIWPQAHAKIKISNKASRALFAKSGYSEEFIIMKNNIN